MRISLYHTYGSLIVVVQDLFILNIISFFLFIYLQRLFFFKKRRRRSQDKREEEEKGQPGQWSRKRSVRACWPNRANYLLKTGEFKSSRAPRLFS
jgi:hypothetical protein